MRPAAVVLLLALTASLYADSDPADRLLLTPRRLKRLERDRERQTERWLNFERDVQSNPQSPERGFNLALYYTVTGDRQRGAEAVAWALAHRSETHQVAVILSWAGDLFTADQHKQLDPQCAAPGRKLLAYFGVAQPATGAYLLQLRPEEVEHPSWKQHLAALALVNLDPNSTASQFLQGWAMEDRFMLRDGPGVGYEFLWANPYLPGVSYQNMDPWSYTRGDLYARADWSDNACWLHIGTRGVEQQNCAQDIMSKALTIGSLMLVPVTDRCMDLHRENPRQTLILSKLRPEAALTYLLEGQKRHAEADQSGLWRVPVEIDGKVCVSK